MGIKNFLVQKFFSYIDNRTKLTTKYSNAFYKVIVNIVQCAVLSEHLRNRYNDYLKKFEIHKHNEEQKKSIASGLMWATINDYCLSIINNYNIEKAKNIIILGHSGVGKTAFICSICEDILSKNNTAKIHVTTHNIESFLLIKKQIAKQYNSNAIISENIAEEAQYTIHELIDSKEADKIKISNKLFKLFILFDSQQSNESIQNFWKEYKFKSTINGIVITKIDFVGSICCLLTAPFITNTKIVAMSHNEITSKNRKIEKPEKLTELIISKIFDQASDEIELTQELNKFNNKAYSMDSYRHHIRMIVALDSSQLSSLAKMVLDMQSSGQVNISKDQLEIIEKVKQSGMNNQDKKELTKSIYIINSMRTSEKGNVDSITQSRITKIAYGSGTTVQDVHKTIMRYKEHRRMYHESNWLK